MRFMCHVSRFVMCPTYLSHARVVPRRVGSTADRVHSLLHAPLLPPMESYLDAVFSSARVHFGQGGRRLLVATSFPTGACPVSALRGMSGSESEGLLACRLVWAEQALAARRMMYCNAPKSACYFAVDNRNVCVDAWSQVFTATSIRFASEGAIRSTVR